MKLLYVTADYIPNEYALTLRVSFNVAALSEKGHDIEVLTTGCHRVGPWGETVYGVSKLPPDNTASLKSRLLREVGIGIAFGFHLLRNRKSYDHVILTSPAFFTMVVTIFFVWMARMPYIVEIRDRYPKVLFSQGVISKSSMIGRVLSKLERRIYQRAQAVVTVTEAVRNDIQTETGVEADVVRNGFDETKFVPIDKPSLKITPVRIVRHGTFGRFFDSETFVKIVQYCQDRALEHEFVLIGYGQPLDEIRKLDLPNVTIYPAMSQVEISDILKSCDIGLSLMPSDNSALEMFPVKIYEYVGCGLPVIALPIGVAGTEIIDYGFGTAFHNEDWEDAAQWLTDFIGSAEMRDKYRSDVHRRREVYSRQAQSAYFAEIIGALRQ